MPGWLNTYMIYESMEDRDFIKSVKTKVGDGALGAYSHALEQIPELYRKRYLLTLDCCPEPAVALGLLYKGRSLPEQNYRRFLQFMLTRPNVA